MTRSSLKLLYHVTQKSFHVLENICTSSGNSMRQCYKDVMYSVCMEQKLISIANSVYEDVGPGYSESVYHRAFEVYLREQMIPYETERILPITVHGHVIGSLRADLIVDKSCIIELKAVSKLSESAKMQTKNYIKLSGISRALLINFPHESDVLVPQILRFGD